MHSEWVLKKLIKYNRYINASYLSRDKRTLVTKLQNKTLRIAIITRNNNFKIINANTIVNYLISIE